VSSFGATTLSVSSEAAFAKELFMEGVLRVDIPRIPSCSPQSKYSAPHARFPAIIFKKIIFTIPLHY
jgi:hypothetical protein